MEIVLVSLLNGLVYGMLLFMLASGLTLIFSMMGVLNFAHASIYMIGAYLAFTVSQYVGFFPALIVAPILCGLVGAAIEIWGLRRVHANGVRHVRTKSNWHNVVFADLCQLPIAQLQALRKLRAELFNPVVQ